MSILFLTPASIGYLTQLILASAMAGYFWYLARRFWQGETSPLPTLLLAGAFTSFACATLLLFLNESLAPDLSFYAMYLESIAVVLFLALFLQFAYRFPALAPGQKWEARVVLWLTVLYALWETGFAVQRYAMLAQGYVTYRPPAADVPLAVGFLWVAIVFLRQTARPSSFGDTQGRPGDRQAGVWRKLWRPEGRGARAARVLALLSLLPLGLAVVDLLRGYFILSQDITELIQSLGILFTLSAFALVYLNYLPETTSLMVKLVGVTLAAFLAILGSVGWIASPAYVAAYHNDSLIADRQTLRFMPNSQGGYDVAQVPFYFEGDLGTNLGPDDVRVELPFEFPFFDRVWREAYISNDGVISFGQAFSAQDVPYRYGPLPAIFLLSLDLTGASDDLRGDSGLYIRPAVDRLTITWYQLCEVRDRGMCYTFQAMLYPSGEFDLTTNGLPPNPIYAIQEPRDAPWLIGAVPGLTERGAEHIRFASQHLPYTGGGRRGMVEDYYLHFRRDLHRFLLPLAYLILGSTVLILLGFPIFFRRNLVQPLGRLLEGVQQANAGNLEVTTPVQYRDEIGFLTQSFNDMAVELQSQTQALRRRAAELEALARVSSALRQAVTSEDMIPILIAETVNALGADAGAVLLLDGDALVVADLHGLPRTLLGHRLPLDDMPCWPVLRTGQPMLADLVEQGMCAACGLCQTLAHNRRALAVAPLQAADKTLGLLLFAFDRPDRWLEEQRRPLVAIAEMGGNALQRAGTMEMLEQLVHDRTHELTALYEVTRMTTRYLDLQVVLERVLEKTLGVVGGQGGIVHLLDGAGERLHLAARRGIIPGFADQMEAQPLDDSLWGQVVKRNETIIETQVPRVLDPFGDTRRVSSYIGLPIHATGRTRGVLSVFGEAGRSFSVEDIALLAGIADHVGVAVQSDRLRQQGQETAVQEERRRLARDLHDSVTQSLHSLVLSADTANYLLEQDRPKPLREALDRLGESARQALKEMRLLLYELRLAPLEGMDLVEVLQTRLEAVEQRAGVEAQLVVDGPVDWPQAWEEELYCIAMEALNNALKHARATQVSVHLRGSQNGVELEVADNGRGFDPNGGRAAGMGLRTMAERAWRLGGELAIESAPGEGTRVRLRLEIGD